MEKNNSNYSPDSRYLLNFSFSQKRLSSKDDIDAFCDLMIKTEKRQRLGALSDN